MTRDKLGMGTIEVNRSCRRCVDFSNQRDCARGIWQNAVGPWCRFDSDRRADSSDRLVCRLFDECMPCRFVCPNRSRIQLDGDVPLVARCGRLLPDPKSECFHPTSRRLIAFGCPRFSGVQSLCALCIRHWDDKWSLNSLRSECRQIADRNPTSDNLKGINTINSLELPHFKVITLFAAQRIKRSIASVS